MQAVKLVKNYAEQHALVLPGRLPSYRLNTDLMILPCTMKKKCIYELYKKATDDTEVKPIGRTWWYDLWNEFCGNVVIQKPRTDLCNICQQQTVSLGTLQALGEDEKMQRIKRSLEHLETVQVERIYYNSVILECKGELTSRNANNRLSKHPPCSYQGRTHYSFDFAQQISLPYSSQQVGALYVLAGYKVALFILGQQ